MCWLGHISPVRKARVTGKDSIQARRGWQQPRMPSIMLSRSIRTCRKRTLLLAVIAIGGSAISPGGWRNSSKLKRVFRITLISPMRSPSSNAGLGMGKRRLTSSVVSLSSILATPMLITLSRLRIMAYAVFPKLSPHLTASLRGSRTIQLPSV